MSYVGLQQSMRQRLAPHIYAVGFSRWKRPILRQFLHGSDITFVRYARKVPENATVAVWGAERPSGLSASAQVLHVEDGFLRSAGLGADFVRPMSWNIDDRGIYYDATRPSRLEIILQTTKFEESDIVRAASLRTSLVAAGITKYNLPGQTWERPKGAARVILVPGQVEGDASIRLGSPVIRTNIDLLKAVRKANPNAYVVYKPHPDVVAGLRYGGQTENGAEGHCDEIVSSGDTVMMLQAVDEVHTMTSLMGFEALLRGLQVVCYGQPFYSGWGLTRDEVVCERRTRRLSLDELVAAALIKYPTYISRVTGLSTTPERTIEELEEWRRQGISKMPLSRQILKFFIGTWARFLKKIGR